MTPADETERRRVPPIGALVLGCGLVLGLVGYWPTKVVAGEVGVRAMMFALASTALVGYATMRPTALRMGQTNAVGRLQLGLRAGVVRMVLTLGIAVLILWRTDVDRRAFLIWVTVAYIVLVKIETVTIVSWCKRLEER